MWTGSEFGSWKILIRPRLKYTCFDPSFGSNFHHLSFTIRCCLCLKTNISLFFFLLVIVLTSGKKYFNLISLYLKKQKQNKSIEVRKKWTKSNKVACDYVRNRTLKWRVIICVSFVSFSILNLHGKETKLKMNT